MQDRLKAATDARDDASFIIMARTDAYAAEGLERAIERASGYVEAGADMIFAEALATLDEFRAFAASLDVPVLANITAASRTMRALKTSRTAEVVQRTVFSNTSRSAAVSSILGARRIAPPL